MWCCGCCDEREQTEGKFGRAIRDIALRVYGAESVEDAERLNVVHACSLIQSNPVVKKYLERGKVEIVPAFYDMQTGKIEFLFDYE